MVNSKAANPKMKTLITAYISISLPQLQTPSSPQIQAITPAIIIKDQPPKDYISKP
jgi:hypothetical protein